MPNILIFFCFPAHADFIMLAYTITVHVYIQTIVITNPFVCLFNVFLCAVFLQTKRSVKIFAGCSATVTDYGCMYDVMTCSLAIGVGIIIHITQCVHSQKITG